MSECEHNADRGYCTVCGIHVHSYDENGFCTIIAGETHYQPASQVEGIYQLGNAGQIYWFAQQVNGGNTGIDGKLTADIVVNKNVLKSDGSLNGDGSNFRAWSPIGTFDASETIDNRYTGTFDGNGHTISGLYAVCDEAGGLFSHVYNGTVKNVGVIDSYVSGGSWVGGVVGCNYGTVTNCYNTGDVSGNDYVGGVVGCNSDGIVDNCYNSGDVSGNDYVGTSVSVGGVVGYNYEGTVSNCHNTGDVSGNDYVGGVVGNNTEGTVSSCYNTGDVLASHSAAGGVVGHNYGTVTNCYNSGDVLASHSTAGGVVGYNYDTVTTCYNTVTDCYNTGDVSGSYYVGGVVGANFEGTVDNCYNTGAVSGSYYVGGVVSYNDDTVTNCYNTGAVSGSYYVGGVVGRNYGDTVTNCYNSGDISGGYDDMGTSVSVGGVVGYNSEGTVSNCHNTGDVLAYHSTAGGVVGYNSEGTVSSCYYLSTCGASGEGTAKTAEQFASGEVAYLLNGDQSDIVFKQTLGADDYPNFTGEPVYQVTCVDIACYSNSNADYAEHEYDDKGVCVNCGAVRCDHSGNTNKHTDCTEDLICSVCDTVITPAAESHSGGTATCTNPAICSVCGLSYGEVDPSSHDFTDNGFCPNCNAYEPAQLVGEIYQIGNAGQLYWFAQQVNEKKQASIKGKLTADIVVNEDVLKEDGTLNEDTFRIWTPIGNNGRQYRGTFDGNGKTVSGLYFNNSSTNYVGLFGYVNGGTVKNVGVVDSYISGSDSVGGVVGDNNGTVSNCHNTSTVSGSYKVGGVVGYSGSSCTVSSCYNTGAVSGIDSVSGVVGRNYGTVSKCHNTGAVSGSSYVGGVVGDNYRTVSNCYNTGTVSGEENHVGGVVSYNDGTGSVSKCHNTGTISGFSDSVGGVVSRNYGTVSDCYNTGTVSGSSFVGGVVSDNYGTVSNCYNTGTVSGSSFVGGAVSWNSGTVSDCYNTGAVSGSSYVGGVVSDNNGTVSNCYYLDTCGASGEGTSKTAAQFKSGEVAYLLNGDQSDIVFKQTLGADDYPNFTGEPVYQVTCGGTGTLYSNAQENVESHTPATDDGDCTTPIICTHCQAVVVAANSSHTPGTDDGDCTTPVSCINCDQIATPAISHNFSVEVATIPATCAKTGTRTMKCSSCNQTTDLTLPIDPENHNMQQTAAKVEPTCEGEGKEAVLTCANGCDKTEGGAPIAATGHDWNEGVVTAAPTCTEPGKMTYTCEKDPAHTKVTDIPANGEHKFTVEVESGKVPATCMAEGTVTMKCSRCEATEEQALPMDPVNHTGNNHIVDAKAATCGAAGYTGDIVCECGTTIISGTAIPATGKHQYDLDEGCDPTCTETGLTIGSSCHVCGFIHLAQIIVPALGHEPVVMDAIAPTCTNTGLSEGSSCGVCGEVLSAQAELPVIDHTAVIDPAVESTCTQTGLTEGSHCASCGKVLVAQESTQEKNHTVIIDPPKDPTCTESGLKGNGMHCDVCKTVLLAQEEILPLGHNWNEATCMAPKTCLVCGAAEGEILGHTGGEATCKAQAVCEECGQSYGTLGEHAYGNLKPAQAEVHSMTELTPAVSAHYVCDVCNTYFTESKEETTLAALTGKTPAHSFGDWITTDADNHWKVCSCGLKTEEGTHTYDNDKDTGCNICGYERVIAHEHTFATTWSKDENNHWYASTCGCDVTSGMEAHEWNAETYTWDENGCQVSRTCIDCGYVKREKVSFVVVNGVLTMNCVPTNLMLMIAGYNGGQMRAIQMVDTVTGNIAIDSKVLNCSSVKIFFLSKTTYAPMCVSELVK